jgi:hypothetical protein
MERRKEGRMDGWMGHTGERWRREGNTGLSNHLPVGSVGVATALFSLAPPAVATVVDDADVVDGGQLAIAAATPPALAMVGVVGTTPPLAIATFVVI